MCVYTRSPCIRSKSTHTHKAAIQSIRCAIQTTSEQKQLAWYWDKHGMAWHRVPIFFASFENWYGIISCCRSFSRMCVTASLAYSFAMCSYICFYCEWPAVSLLWVWVRARERSSQLFALSYSFACSYFWIDFAFARRIPKKNRNLLLWINNT